MQHRHGRGPRPWSLSLIPAGALLLAVPAAAQETGDAQPPVPTESPSVEAAKSFTPQDFVRFAPKTALDMLRQVPGFIIQQEDQQRGLGEGSGNILINGRRTSGKSNDALTELSRISAGNVSRIDIVDGATLDIPGLTGQVANVIAQVGGASGQFAWRPEFRLRYTEPLLLRGEASYSGSTGAFGYTIGIRNEAFRGGGAGPGIILSAGDEILDRRRELIQVEGDRPKVSGSLNYRGSGGSIANLNGSYGFFWFDLLERSSRSGPGQVDRVRTLRNQEREREYEISGDYEFAAGPGRLKLIGLHQFEKSPFDSRLITAFADASPSTGTRFTRTADEEETIGRAEYRWKKGVADWQVSVEGALNSLDNVSALLTLLPTGDFEAVPLPGGTARVEEERAEARLTYGRPLSSSLTIQASVAGEYSKLSQSGDEGATRIFYRPKGFLSVAWKASPRLDLNAKLERKVGQLSFGDFLATENLSNDNRNSGNPDLVPPQSWELDVSGTRNFGAFGLSTLRLFTRLISDIVDQVPIGDAGESPGNLDTATLFGLESKSTFLFDPLGWAGAKLDARVQLQRSSLGDPLTGDPREISGSNLRTVELALRHDVPRTDWAWGGAVNHVRQAPNFRLGEIALTVEGPVNGNLFVEHKDVLGLTLRGTVGNIFGSSNVLTRTVFAGRRTGPISFREKRRRSGGPIFAFSISGNI